MARTLFECEYCGQEVPEDEAKNWLRVVTATLIVPPWPYEHKFSDFCCIEHMVLDAANKIQQLAADKLELEQVKAAEEEVTENEFDNDQGTPQHGDGAPTDVGR